MAETYINLRKQFPQPEALRLIPEDMARKYNAIPVSINGNTLVVAIANPTDIFALEALETRSRMRIEPRSASVSDILESIDFNYRSYAEIEKQVSNIFQNEEAESETIRLSTVTDAPVAQALILIIDEAVKARASDIHIQPQEDKLRVRYRIDGTLHDTISLPLATGVPLISRIKVLANMNIADRHRPQDGQFSVDAKGRLLDIRVATIPTVYGEMASLRLLYKARATMTLPELGFSNESLAIFEKMLKIPYGMILVSGPTGAGKTTTLYASINCLDRVGRNIITIEDPVEYRFTNINQIQVNPKAGLTFASGLRSILRLDPNVILVGEIRDAETANIAVQSALTGHLVLSSIHANDAVGVIFRLLDLGVDPFMVASSLAGIVAQRMVRRICPECARPVKVSMAEQLVYSRETGDDRNEFLYGSGCHSCSQTGYMGRMGIFEIFNMSDEIRTMLIKGTSTAELKAEALKEDMVTLLKDGMLKVKANLTTPSEVLRNAYAVE
ncbi:MAG: type II/IV secretion system protein [Dehalococcoidales bacterium]|nr:type II/IV secretion system protein [Dehalococcoidales bacterium]